MYNEMGLLFNCLIGTWIFYLIAWNLDLLFYFLIMSFNFLFICLELGTWIFYFICLELGTWIFYFIYLLGTWDLDLLFFFDLLIFCMVLNIQCCVTNIICKGVKISNSCIVKVSTCKPEIPYTRPIINIK